MRFVDDKTKGVETREEDLKVQGKKSTLAVERLRMELEESRAVLFNLQVS